MNERAELGRCVCVLCGLPAVGKSTLTRLLSHHLHTRGWRTFTICYDEFIPQEAFHFHTPQREEEESSKEAGWKQYRHAVLECVDSFLQELSADGPHTHTGGGSVCADGPHTHTGGGSVCERFREAMEKQQILPLLQNTHSGPQQLVLLLDDNFYYHSMRYQVYQLARRRSVGFCEIYLHCPLEVCLHRNRVRGQPVPDDVIAEMSNRMEPPNTVKNQWERNSVTVDNTNTVTHTQLYITHTHTTEVLQAISSAVENPLSPIQDDSEQREADRQRCACSVVHQVDQVCRRLVSQAMVTARAHRQSGEELKGLARALGEEKNLFLQELRAQVLQQLGQDECVCVERVVNIATDTFTRRTRVMLERHGVDSTSSSESV
ncbi:L-seryl-tRNA(Sec) kinase-like isoform X2 [Neoarius graeffei]|uniref:L-seryl-tRNA(Sec) kinase-like isoform X2 n=1 Tax=Neoarius graeffei TaxID=443677 RepID=UPI00298BE2C2|nr:L-seryl-tRNA(Sec) kinase-like isoform X2 [Neoarius graeffei]